MEIISAALLALSLGEGNWEIGAMAAVLQISRGDHYNGAETICAVNTV